MFNIVGAIVAGAIVGALARWFCPGAVDMGWLNTILLGIGGSLLAGSIVNRGRSGIHRAGCPVSIPSAMALILAGRSLEWS